MYGIINEALNRAFLGGRFESRPLYLVLDGRGRQNLAEILGIPPGEVDEHCCSVVGESLAKTGDPYARQELELWKWSMDGRKGLPPFTALLFTLSHAAELMVSDSQFNAANYYQRLAAITGVPSGKLSFHGRSTEQFWRALNKWLADTNFRFGRPTARAVNANRYVGIAMSQAIVREEDRLRFHHMFERYGFTGTDAITEEEISQYIESWINTSKPTRQLKAAWSKPELRPRIAEIAVAELEDWTADVGGAEGSSARAGKRLSLAVSFRDDVISRGVSLWLGREDDIDDLEVRATGTGTPLRLGNSFFGGFATVEPRRALDLQVILSRGIALTAGDGEQFNWAARAVIPLSRSSRGTYWSEVNRVTIGLEHVVLVRADPGVRRTVEGVLEEVAALGYTVATPTGLVGLPSGWLLYEKVVAVRQMEHEPKGFEAALSPVGQSSGLQFIGGLKLGRGIWHEWNPADAVVETGGANPTISAWEGTSREGEPLFQADSVVGRATLPLRECVTSSGALYVEGSSGDELIGTGMILLRSANKARPLDRAGRGELAYLEPLSACSVMLAGADSARGMHAPAVEEKAPGVELSAFLDLDHASAAPEEPLLEEGPGQGRTEAMPEVSKLTVDEQLQLPCAVRGFHYFKLETVRPDYPRYAPVNMECAHCELALLHRRSKKTVVSRRREARCAVPESPRAAPSPRNSLPSDLWLDAACFLGCGSVASFEALLSEAEIDPWQAGATLRDLTWLGHLDVCLGDNHRPRCWSVAPPSLAFVSKEEAVLAGFRSSSLVDAVEKLASSAGGGLHREALPGQPALIRVSGMDLHTAAEALGGVTDPHGRTMNILDSAALSLANFSAASSSIFARLNPITLGFDGDVQRYEPEKGRWVSTGDTRKPGGYRFAYAGTTYAYRTPSGRALAGPHELVKLAAARHAGVHLHAYSGPLKVFSSRLGCEPPGLLGRALVACSGRLPEVVRGESRFASVPPPVAAAVLDALYSGDLPS